MKFMTTNDQIVTTRIAAGADATTPQADLIGRISVSEHALAMEEYIAVGKKKAQSLKNRGPIKFTNKGKLDPQILDAYWEHGFYVFEDVIKKDELSDLKTDIAKVLEHAPLSPDLNVGDLGRPTANGGFEVPAYRFAKPLSDPVGGTNKNKGRHPVKMIDPRPMKGMPDWTIENLVGNLQLMDSSLRLYGHPGLLSVAEAVNGPDFVPYNEVTFIKEPGLGPSVAWHQDGTTHWDSPDWDHGAHGFNFMAQLYPSTPGNSVWVLPGSHKLGKIDIRKLVEVSGSERIRGAVPLLGDSGDVFISNRQLVHGSFANSSLDRRVTLNAGFFPKPRVLDVTTTKLNGKVDTYDVHRILERCRMIQIGIDARRQYFPHEVSYCYQPLQGKEDENRWNEETRETTVKNYNLLDMYI